MEREETATAVIERVDANLVICRYKHGVRVDAIAVAENLEARLRFIGKEPYAVVGVFPADVDFDMTLLEQNLYTDVDLNEITQLLAIVAEGSLFTRIARFYFTRYPTPFASLVFPTEEEALAWVNERIAARKNKR